MQAKDGKNYGFYDHLNAPSQPMYHALNTKNY